MQEDNKNTKTIIDMFDDQQEEINELRRRIEVLENNNELLLQTLRNLLIMLGG